MSTVEKVAEALQEAVNGLRKRGKKRKRATRFTGLRDIVLLEAVVSVNPFKEAPPTTAWTSVSKKIKKQVAVSPRCCRERTVLLLEQFVKGDFSILHRHCTMEEFVLKKELLRQVQQQCNNGAGGYKSRLGGASASAARALAGKNGDRSGDPVEVEAPRVGQDEHVPPGPCVIQLGTISEQKQKGASSSQDMTILSKRLRLADARPSTSLGSHNTDVFIDDGVGLIERALASGDAQPAHLLGQAMSLLRAHQDGAMRTRAEDLNLRREELNVQWAKLRLGKDRLSLEKAQFQVERAERERKLRSEKQAREHFMEQLNCLVNSANL